MHAGPRRDNDTARYPYGYWLMFIIFYYSKISRDPSGTHLLPTDKNSRVPAGNTASAPWAMTYGTRAGTVWVCWLDSSLIDSQIIDRIGFPIKTIPATTCYTHRLKWRHSNILSVTIRSPCCTAWCRTVRS